MTKQEKQQIETALKTATDNTIKKQDIHRERISIMEECGNKDYLTKPPLIDWNNINEAMADECWPADHEDRKKLLKQNWDEIPSKISIDQIEDKDIAGRTYILNEVVEQCYRIKALANFFEVLNANPKDSDANLFFRYWAKHSILSQLAKEQLESGNQEKGKDLQQMAELIENIVNTFAKNPEALKKLLLMSIEN